MWICVGILFHAEPCYLEIITTLLASGNQDEIMKGLLWMSTDEIRIPSCIHIQLNLTSSRSPHLASSAPLQHQQTLTRKLGPLTAIGSALPRTASKSFLSHRYHREQCWPVDPFSSPSCFSLCWSSPAFQSASLSSFFSATSIFALISSAVNRCINLIAFADIAGSSSPNFELLICTYMDINKTLNSIGRSSHPLKPKRRMLLTTGVSNSYRSLHFLASGFMTSISV